MYLKTMPCKNTGATIFQNWHATAGNTNACKAKKRNTFLMVVDFRIDAERNILHNNSSVVPVKKPDRHDRAFLHL
jgi:hypothetical protein